MQGERMQCEKATYYQKNKALRTRRKEESPQWILIRENAQQGQRKRCAFREGCSRVESVAGWKRAHRRRLWHKEGDHGCGVF